MSYKNKKYRVRGAAGIEQDLSGLPEITKKQAKRVFLADGNALAMNTNELLDVLSMLSKNLPALERVGVYGYTKDVRNKTAEDLAKLRNAGLGIVYLGLETGDDELLRCVRKGVTSEENVRSCKKIRDAKILLSLTVILGLGGIEYSGRHAIATAKALNEIDPEYVGALTLMIPKGTPLHQMTIDGEFVPMEPFDILQELRNMMDHTKLSNCIFRTNHASNYLPLRGTLDRDKRHLLRILDSALEQRNEDTLRPSYLRDL